MDIPLRSKNASIRLWKRVCETPYTYIKSSLDGLLLSNFIKLSYYEDKRHICEGLVDIFDTLEKPLVFYNRVQDPKDSNFTDVDDYFKNVVDKVFEDTCFKAYEMGKSLSTEPFMNVELYKAIKRSSIVFSDITSLRPNCMLELGYALGLGKKIIISAKRGTELPWDTDKIHTYKWSPEESFEKRRGKLRKFLNQSINKNPLS